MQITQIAILEENVH